MFVFPSASAAGLSSALDYSSQNPAQVAPLGSSLFHSAGSNHLTY